MERHRQRLGVIRHAAGGVAFRAATVVRAGLRAPRAPLAGGAPARSPRSRAGSRAGR